MTVEAAKLVPFAPSTLGSFTATGPASPLGSPPDFVNVFRSYKDAGGRELTLRLSTGDIGADLGTIDTETEHAFGSDTPTYWRTTSIAGHRARIGEERPTLRSSTCLVRVGPNHVAEVKVAPASTPGECAAPAALLDFAGITATGGLASPMHVRR
ncbi:MAG TPA: hypothetical protein VF407_17350 [Polyangiaceae bacterium]